MAKRKWRGVFRALAGDPKQILGKYKQKHDGVPDQTLPTQDELGAEQANYADINRQANEGATADAKRAGTYADTREFQTSLQSEAGARQRGLEYNSIQKQNALRIKLGLPPLPASPAPAAATPPAAP